MAQGHFTVRNAGRSVKKSKVRDIKSASSTGL
nr:MAG TPA: hypothetical protein [Caudoviricetes sp.]